MAITLTSTAYTATPKTNHTDVDSVSFRYTSAAGVTFCASANATIVLGQEFQQVLLFWISQALQAQVRLQPLLTLVSIPQFRNSILN